MDPPPLLLLLLRLPLLLFCAGTIYGQGYSNDSLRHYGSRRVNTGSAPVRVARGPPPPHPPAPAPSPKRGDIPITDSDDGFAEYEGEAHPLSETHNQGSKWRGYPPHRLHPCDQSSCYPATGNLLIGREKQLHATSTCGLFREEKYCIVSHLEEQKKCFRCDSRPMYENNPQYSHTIKNVVYRNSPNTRGRSWWQAENGKENVSIQLDLEAEFHFTHVIITFKTFRPAAMLIERSYDFGLTWQVYRYFAANCDHSFPGVPKHAPRSLTDVVCESRYSKVAPSTEGEIIFRVLPPALKIDDPYSQEVQNLLKMTNLRINFTKLHTLGDDLLDNRQEIQEKYYYAIYEMIVRGSCSCYGHASRCLPLDGVDPRPDMVHGRCDCTHHTKGFNCELCEDFYNELPWKPAIGKQSNACKQCNCNNHTTSCHFDNAVYEQSGRISGGVCDGCEHNTMGRNCEECKPYFYHDPSRPITDPEACQPCDCDPRGSVDEAICDSRSDEANGLDSGHCHCKTYVDGRRCDRCKNGYWNFDETNPDGCQECTCNTLGTVDNQGCDMNTGECTCKRNVIGRDCNQCLPQHFGLSEDSDGCKPCDCDSGGAFDNDCDVITGQCRCRPHVTGRQCNQPDQAFYAGMMDFNVYEAELALGSEDCQVVIREPHQDGQENTWTGFGFMRTFENSDLDFVVDDVRTSMDYDIVIRYEPQNPNGWEDVRVNVIRDGPIERDGPCANSRPEDDVKFVKLSAGERSAVVLPPACLEANKLYHITLSFKKYDKEGDKPTASILVDSIALIPRPESIPFFRETPENIRQRDDFERYRCGEYFASAIRRYNIPEICKQFYNSIGFYVQNGAHPCECDKTGSTSTLCKSLGGQCECKSYVVGRRCDRCAPGTFGFSPEGCTPCECNSIGSLDNICDQYTGQCKCRPNMYGRECDQCQPGFWSFPNCQRCQCNGYADTCDSYTGLCIDCRNNTNGTYCDSCNVGYYGDPRLEKDIPCRPCRCPDTQDSGHSFASQCSLDPYSQDVVCECQEGYSGSRCDVCADNYFGNPDSPGGSCVPCNCSKNVDISRPGNCDHRTGQCMHCLFDTEGFNCEICKAGFYGDAVNQRCTECVCNVLGTNETAGPCDRNTGQCPCLPNVVGLSCDDCKVNHWKIASGQGCEPCDCDSTGSDETQCNQFDGQCRCKPGYGGRKCDQCEANSWGNPNVECHPCTCNPEGAAKLQCHQNNGSCVCMPGIGGYNCDECARGYLGAVPYCRECGECFNNWDRVLQELKQQTTEVLKSASEIRLKGATGAYSRQFETMLKKIDEVKKILDDTRLSAIQLDDLQSLVNQLRRNLNQSMEGLGKVEDLGKNTSQRILVANLTLSDLRVKLDMLRDTAQNLRDNATHLQESNVEGALNLTRRASHRSRQAQQEAERTKELSAEAEKLCKRTENLVGKSSDRFQQIQDDNNKELENLSERLEKLEDMIPGLNEQVCGRSDSAPDGCDPLCGGAGCGFCGGLSCENGAARKAEQALGYAQDADKRIREKDGKAEELFQGVSLANQETEQARKMVKDALQKAQIARNTSEISLNDSTALAERLEEFLNVEHATPNDISLRASETLKQEIQLEPEQITKLAADINQTISSLTDIESIIEDTRDDIDSALLLKIEAIDAKTEASNVLKTAEEVLEALEEAREAQDKAEQAIEKANSDIQAAGKDLAQISSETEEAQTKANETKVEVDKLQGRVRDLQTRFLKNSRDVEELKSEADMVVREGASAKDGAEKLRLRYDSAATRLQERARLSGSARQRAQKILEKASSLSITTSRHLTTLEEMSEVYSSNERQLEDLTFKIDELNSRMDEYLRDIKGQAEYYSTCTS